MREKLHTKFILNKFTRKICCCFISELLRHWGSYAGKILTQLPVIQLPILKIFLSGTHLDRVVDDVQAEDNLKWLSLKLCQL